MAIVLLHLKGPWAKDGKDTDRGILQVRIKGDGYTLTDNDFGLNRRTYPEENVACIEYKSGWSD